MFLKCVKYVVVFVLPCFKSGLGVSVRLCTFDIAASVYLRGAAHMDRVHSHVPVCVHAFQNTSLIGRGAFPSSRTLQSNYFLIG